LTLGANDGSTATFSGVISDNANGPLSLVKSGSFTQILAGANTFSGSLTVSGGTLDVTQKLSAYNGTGTITLGGGSGLPTLQFSGSNDVVGTSRPINLAGDAALAASETSDPGHDNFEMDGAISGNNHNLTLTGSSVIGGELGGVMNLGSGSLTKTGNGLWALDKANTMAGVTINAGTLLVTTAVNLGTGTLAFTGGSGTLDIEPVPTSSTAAYSDTRSITLAANGTILQDNSNGATLSGVISGSGDLFKTGPGNLILSGASNSFGGTVVNQGMLTVTTIGALPTNQSLTIAAGGTLVFDPDYVANGDSLAAGLEGDSPIFVEQNSGRSPGLAAVPEPGTLVLLGVALWSAAIYRRFRRRGRRIV
jgi:autotransporter-associated beta strand protein